MVDCINLTSKDIFSLFKKAFYLFIFVGEKERERNIDVWEIPPFAHPQLGTWPTTQACALTGNWTCKPAALIPLNHTSQGYFFSFFIFVLYSKQIFTKQLFFKSLTETNVFWLRVLLNILAYSEFPNQHLDSLH